MSLANTMQEAASKRIGSEEEHDPVFGGHTDAHVLCYLPMHDLRRVERVCME